MNGISVDAVASAASALLDQGRPARAGDTLA
jgi:hypothetical protein